MKEVIGFRIIFFVLALASCSSNVDEKYECNILYINNIKGNVKSILSETYKAEKKYGEIQKGELLKDAFYFPMDNMVTCNSFYEFTKDGKMKSIQTNSSFFSYQLICEYDGFGNIVEQSYEYNGVKQITKYKIEKDKIISSVMYNEEGGKTHISDYSYTGDLIKEISYKDTEGVLVNKMKYSYKNDLQIQSIYDNNGKLMQEVKKDINGRNIEMYMSVIDEKSQYIYKEGIAFPVEVRNYKNNEIQGTIVFSFDEKYNIVDMSEMDKNGNIDKKYSFSYRYDDKENWIEQIVYEDGDLKYVITRKIEYFEN